MLESSRKIIELLNIRDSYLVETKEHCKRGNKHVEIGQKYSITGTRDEQEYC